MAKADPAAARLAMLDPPVYEGTDRPGGGGGGGAAGGAGGGRPGAAGDVEAAAWAVDTDEEEEEGGGVAWEEVELPERNEDIDPEVGSSLLPLHNTQENAAAGFIVSRGLLSKV